MTDTEYRIKLFEQLDQLEHRYRRFMRGALVAIGILTVATLWQLFVALPAKTDQIQQSRQSVVGQFCEDEKALLSLVPAGYPPLVVAVKRNPNSALNPKRDCHQFVRQFIRP